MSIIRPKVAWGSEALPPMITQLYAHGLRVPPLAQVRDDGGGVVTVEGRAEVAPRLGKGGLQWRLANTTRESASLLFRTSHQYWTTPTHPE